MDFTFGDASYEFCGHFELLSERIIIENVWGACSARSSLSPQFSAEPGSNCTAHAASQESVASARSVESTEP